MTNVEAIRQLNTMILATHIENMPIGVLEDIRTALHMAIGALGREALEQEPCDDCISRQAALDLLQMRLMPKEEYKAIYELPSVTPAPRIGRWIPVGYDGYADGNPVYDWWECSECEWEHTGDEDTLTPYCPNCGAKMEEVEG